MMEREPYAIRGKRVPYLSDSYISKVANAVASFYGINRKTAKHLGLFMEDVQNLGPVEIVIDVVSDDHPRMPKLVKAYCDPKAAKITLRNNLYIRITDGDMDAAHTLFHELGHLFLMHDPTLHNEPEESPCRNEDSEYQADRFADRIMQKIAGKNWREGDAQLELFK